MMSTRFSRNQTIFIHTQPQEREFPMKKRSIFTVLFMALLVCVLAGTSTSTALAQETDQPMGAKAIWLGHYDALEAGDMDTAMSYVDEGVVSIVLPPPPGTDPVSVGAKAFADGVAFMISRHVSYEWLSMQEQGDSLTFRVRVNEDFWRELGVGPIDFSGTAAMRNGLLVSETWIMDEFGRGRLRNAIARMNNLDTMDRFYREVWTDGNMETLDEIIGEDFIDHFSGQNGREAFRSTIGLFRSAFPDLDVSYENALTDGDLVVAQVTFVGTYAGGAFGEVFGVPDSAIGKEITLTGVDYARIVDGQYVEGWGSHDELGWFGQFGLELKVAE